MALFQGTYYGFGFKRFEQLSSELTVGAAAWRVTASQGAALPSAGRKVGRFAVLPSVVSFEPRLEPSALTVSCFEPRFR